MTNVVLDAARRVFVEDSGEDTGISFFPTSYMVPLAVRSGDIQDLDIAAMALNLAAKEVVEFGVQLGPLTMDQWAGQLAAKHSQWRFTSDSCHPSKSV